MKCPYCKNNNTFTYYKAEMPNILSACPKSMLGRVKIFPFVVKLCPKCLLGFNSTKLDDDELKAIYDNYLYISPTSGIGHTKYKGMIETLKKHYSKTDKLVEIGCSEGYLLNRLKSEGYENLIGIEPGPRADQASELGLIIFKDYFNENIFNGRFVDGFYLMHVFEHFDNPFLILEIMGKQLSPYGKIIMEVPNFYGYHHQHLFFYNLPFLAKLCDEKGFKIIEKTIEMGALRVVIVHKDNDKYNKIEFFENPKEITAYARKLYNEFTKTVIWMNQILYKNIGKKVYWWGAGSSSVIYLNQIHPNIREKVEIVIVDGDKNKEGCYIPGVNLKVNSYEILKGVSIDFLIIASSLYNEIQTTMANNKISAKKIKVVE